MVKSKGQPVKKAATDFGPLATGLAAIGEVENGEFKGVSTQGTDDGGLPGKSMAAILPDPPDSLPVAPWGRQPVSKLHVDTASGVPISDRRGDLLETKLFIEIATGVRAFDLDLIGLGRSRAGGQQRSRLCGRTCGRALPVRPARIRQVPLDPSQEHERP
jgi:hypothetical protein